MDPVENLKQQRELAAEILRLADSDASEAAPNEIQERLADAAIALAELVRALDEWRSKGGFDPYQLAGA